MAIVIPVAMHGMSTASRAGIAGQRKAAAARIAERLLNQQIIPGQMNGSSASGTIDDGDFSYAWTLTSEQWTEDTMTYVSVKVTFSVQGTDYDVGASTLYDPTAGTVTVTPPTVGAGSSIIR